MKNKIISLEQALGKIKSKDMLVTGLGAAEGRAILQNLHTIAGRIDTISVTTCLPMTAPECFTNPAYNKKFLVDSFFHSGATRKFMESGMVSYMPGHLHQWAVRRLDHAKPNIYFGSATPPDKHGYMSLSLSNVFERRMIDAADMVILEINPKYPRTFGDVEIHVNDVDYMVEVDYDPPYLPNAEPSEKDLIIGKLIAEDIENGNCIQLGIGGIPNAVTASLGSLKDLGVHTEMLTSGIVDLVNKGAISGKYKTLDKGKMVCAFALGDKALYEFMDDNPAVSVLDAYYVNNPQFIAQNKNQISINTTIEVDLTGQCCSESLGPKQFSGTGGQSDTAVGAQRSEGGRSYITLYSTAMVKNPETGEREEISKIVPSLKPGAAVSLSRNDVQYVVTEYGKANLRGTTVEERVKRLIAIAHPKFRDELAAQARELGFTRS